MKKGANFWGFIISFVLAVLFFVIYYIYIEHENVYVIDNPTDQPLTLKVDDEVYTMSGNQKIDIKLNGGKHTIELISDSTQGQIHKFNVTEPNGVLNPTGSVYYIFRMPYGVGLDVDSIFRSQHTTIDNKVYFGQIQPDSSLFIEHYYYGLDQPFPDLVLKSYKDTLQGRLKIFRKSDFKQFYFEKFE